MNRKATENFMFNRPPEAPVFKPTEDEFREPLVYINKIRPVAERYGICKIKPPSNWQPPFAVDVDSFKFTPRIQRLNELEAKTRIKLNFLDQIAKFWELQGSSLKIPIIDKKALDLHSLYEQVQDEGGASRVKNDVKWNRIASRLGYSSQKNYGALLRQHYEKILYPFDVFQASKDGGSQTTKKAQKPSKGRIGRPRKDEDKLAKYMCHVCRGGDSEDMMLLCDGCDDSYHTFCLKPPLTEVPKGDWRCPTCVAEEVSKPCEAFGFEQAQREYTLQQFGEMADQFKSEYFNMPVHKVTPNLVEKEFWRIVSAIDEDVTVEYGADLHTMDHGSGFPTPESNNISPNDEVYIKSGWNLNNLPVLPGSVLGHINADISGMKVPWMYVGMCFATFCWHNEDHWSYSINYLHWGEPKTWYGVPGGRADDFEKAMKSAAPELFESQPDLLHQLVTIMNPNILMKANVPVYRMDQKAGEFIVTFPRAYHAGFNQGYNFAEAVNFAPADWLAMGRECINHYSNLHRFCVFSHDELVCKMATKPEELDLVICIANYKDMITLLESEKEHRKNVLTWGVTRSERIAFELLPDDERLCDFCKTTCFLSGISCPCTEKLVCLKHYNKLCSCPPKRHVMKYRYTLVELPSMIKNLKNATKSYEDWTQKIQNGLYSNKKTLTVDDLKNLVEEAGSKNYPRTDTLESAEFLLLNVNKIIEMTKRLLFQGSPKQKETIGCNNTLEGSKFKMTIQELNLLSLQIEKLPVKLVNDAAMLKTLQNRTSKFRLKAAKLLESGYKASLVEMEALLEDAANFPIEIPELGRIKQMRKRSLWLDATDFESEKYKIQVKEGTLWTLEYLESAIETGENLTIDEAVKCRLSKLKELRRKVITWEEDAKVILSNKAKFKVLAVQGLFNQMESINVAMPSFPELKSLLNKALNWVVRVNDISKDCFLDELLSCINKGQALPIVFEQMKELKKIISKADDWVETCSRAFLRRSNGHRQTLLEVLLPRSRVVQLNRKKLWKNGSMLNQASVILGSTIGNIQDIGKLTKLLNERWHEETEHFLAKRERNYLKRRQDNGSAWYCLCQRAMKDSYMLRCELCLEWYHPFCVTLPKLENCELPDDRLTAKAVMTHKIITRQVRYLCEHCVRSRRPKLVTILSLLVQLRSVKVRVVEGEILNYLTSRITDWLDRAETILKLHEVQSGLKKLVEADSSLKSKPAFSKIISNHQSSCSVKIEPGSKLHGSDPTQEPASSLFNAENRSAIGILTNRRDENVIAQPTKAPHRNNKFIDELMDSHGDSGHASFNHEESKEGIDHLENTSYSYKLPHVTLSEELQLNIENLLIEADIMEVSLEETYILWTLLEASRNKSVDVPSVLDIKAQIEEESPAMNKRKSDSSVSPSKKARRSDGTVDEPLGDNDSKMEIGTDAKEDQEPIEYDDDCAAKPCKQPSGKQVNWVQCDGGCELWFHIICVGLKKSLVQKLEQYICNDCKPLKKEEKRQSTEPHVKQEPS